MKRHLRFILLVAFSLAFVSCVTGIKEEVIPPPPPPPPTPGSLVAPTAAQIEAKLQAPATATYCMEPRFAWGPITMDECTSAPDTPPVTDIVYEMTGLPAWLTFDPDTRELSLSTGSTTVPAHTGLINVTYTCYSASDPTITTFLRMNINDCDGGGYFDGGEDANSAVPALIDGVGYISLTLRNIDEYLPPGIVGDERRIRSNLTYTATVTTVDGSDVFFAGDDTTDIDGDGDPNDTDPAVFIAASSASLTGTTLANANVVDSIASGDLNNDGIPDLLVGRSDGRISTYLNNGAGAFAVAFNNIFAGINQPVVDIAVADVETSGRLGAVAAAPANNSFIVTGGDGTGFLKLNQTITIPAVNPSFVVAADFNNDNFIDVGAVTIADNNLRIYLNNGFGVVALANTYGTCISPTNMANADIDADGNMDIAISCNPGDVIRTFYGLGNGQFDIPATDYPTGNEPMSIAVADFNADGNLDFGIGSTSAAIDLQVILCSGDRTCQGVVTFDVNAIRTVVAADMNGDGFPDMAGVGGAGLRVFLNDGTGLGYTETTYDLGGPNGIKITAADYNGGNMIGVALTNTNVPPADNINVFLQ